MNAQLLLVEDERCLRRTLRKLLESLGFSVSEAGSLAEARSHLDAQRDGMAFDAAIIDVGLPDGSGLDLLPEVGEARAIVVSAMADVAPLATRSRVMRKPFELAELVSEVRRVSGGAHSDRPRRTVAGGASPAVLGELPQVADRRV